MTLSSSRGLAPSAVLPAYDGGSIASIPPTVGRLLDAREGWGASPAIAAWDSIEPVDAVVLVVLDGVGLERWSRWADELAPGLRARASRTAPGRTSLTSVLPSTTSVATTCLLGCGATPVEHGMLGYTLRLPHPGIVANLLFWRPEYGPGSAGSLTDWGVSPEGFLPTPSIFEVLARQGVHARAFMPSDIARSPLTRLQMRGAHVAAWVGLADALHQVEAWLRSVRGRRYAYLYVPDLDTLSHRDGPDGAAGHEAMAAICGALDRWLDRLPSRLGRMRVVVTADHGHVATPSEEARHLADVPEAAAMLTAPMAGEPRHAYLYARNGATDELRALIEERLGDAFVVVPGEAAVAEGWYGPAHAPHPEATRRIGDVVAVARGGATLWSRRPERHPLGMHGGFDPAEMRVPLLAIDL